MASSKKYFPLLKLPRELRDKILDYAIYHEHNMASIGDIVNTSDSNTKIDMVLSSLDRHPARGLLYTCRQLKSETLRRNRKHKITVDISFSRPGQMADYSRLECTAIVPMQLSRNIETLNFHISPDLLIKALEMDRQRNLFNDHWLPKSAPHQEIDPWTKRVTYQVFFHISYIIWNFLSRLVIAEGYVVRSAIVLFDAGAELGNACGGLG